ncbi:MAG: tRNA (adenosine(37)-N6)-threonylcarbamoyltransferase complex ATPase subunit type 1 TsaE [Ferruginibacter sp.]|nr:tRNA (adenosine(37)-N6)-threonylcarbamoyltransferase complex ATPase subunit type 1 TsaE [Cytophagales bacterium]
MRDVDTLTDLRLDCNGLDELETIAARVIAFAGHSKIWLLEGEMGAGKTTLVRAICRQLGVTGSVQSPTYSLVNEYVTGDQRTLYHFDFYRIRDEAEAMDMGAEEYFDSGNLCLVEWPGRIPGLLPAQRVTIRIRSVNHSQRTLYLSKDGQ